MSAENFTHLACPNPDCPAYGHTGQGNLQLHGWSGTGKRIRCLRCSICGRDFSERANTAFFRTVDVPPGVQANPSDQTAVKGKATFSVVLTGTKPAVQWQVSSDGGNTWSNVKGATTATFTLKSLTSLQDQWENRVLVTNAPGTFTSGAGMLSV